MVGPVFMETALALPAKANLPQWECPVVGTEVDRADEAVPSKAKMWLLPTLLLLAMTCFLMSILSSFSRHLLAKCKFLDLDTANKIWTVASWHQATSMTVIRSGHRYIHTIVCTS